MQFLFLFLTIVSAYRCVKYVKEIRKSAKRLNEIEGSHGVGGRGVGGRVGSNIESIPIFAYSPHTCEQVEKWAERCFTQQFGPICS